MDSSSISSVSLMPIFWSKHTSKGWTIRKVMVGGVFSAHSPGYLIEQNFNPKQSDTVKLNSIWLNLITQQKSNMEFFVGLNIEQTEIASFGFLDVRLDIPGFQKFLKTNIASVFKSLQCSCFITIRRKWLSCFFELFAINIVKFQNCVSL